MMSAMEWLPEDWNRALAVVAHPDDMEYGAAAAVARWTAQGKDIRYLLVTRGEAGIETMSPDLAGPAREAEQRASCAEVGVTEVEFLDHHDGMVVPDIRLRLDLARAIRRHRPEVLLSINFRESWGGPSWNHADHRAVGIALLDAVRDAGNSWLAQGLDDPAWSGVRFAAFNASPQSTHAVDITETYEAGVRSLLHHRVYLEALGDDETSVRQMLRGNAEGAGEAMGVELATSWEMIVP